MKYKKYTITTTTAAEDFLGILLDELGIQGMEIENNVPLTKEDQADMFIDFLPELPPDDGRSCVSFYLEDGESHEEILMRVREGIEAHRAFVDMGEGTIAASDTQDADWLNNWKEFFHSFCIGNILIKPTWEALQESDRGKVLIEIDPGISFGTGKHETTQICIRQLAEYVRKDGGQRVLDIGCGSGILSIVAKKLGAGFVTGTDLDENCIHSSQENWKGNHLPEEDGRFFAGNLMDDMRLLETAGRESYDIAVANILADVIIPMTPVAYSLLKRGGIFITSGIIDFKEKEVLAAIEAAGMKILAISREGEWVGITAQKQ